MSSISLTLPANTSEYIEERSRNIGFVSMSALVALFIVGSGNWTFFDKALSVYSLQGNVLFIISLGLALFCSVLFVIGTLALVFPIRWAASLTLLLACFIAYFTDQYGTIINQDIILSMFESNVGEAQDLLNPDLLIHLALYFALPTLFVLWASVNYQPANWIKERFKAIKLLLLAISLLATNVFLFSDHYASFIRQHKSIRYYSNPAYGLYSLGKVLSEHSASAAPKQFQQLSHYASSLDADRQGNLVILVVGETARADHFSLNGYQRETNPYLSQESNLVSFTHVSSCATVTAVSVPCMFSLFPSDDFELSSAANTENVLDVLNKAGVSVLWRDNNSDSKGVANRINYQNFQSSASNPNCDAECRDIGMLAGLDQYIERQNGDILVVLHQMGSHGPAYYKRYPNEYKNFHPTCNTSELSECSKSEIVNAYDNSIRYTDFFLSRVIALLKQHSTNYKTAMLYVSDHGESLGEHGIYLHGMPYTFAPEAQTHVPFIVWTGDKSNVDPLKTAKHRDDAFSHDQLKTMLFDLFSIDSDASQYFAKQQSILQKVRA